jgi:AcrR family transcriptional regulator
VPAVRNLVSSSALIVGEAGGPVREEAVVEQAGAGRKTRDLERTRAALLHHFPSREALIVALVEDANHRFRETVLAHVDPSENEPGRLLRAYVRALCSPLEPLSQYFTSAPTWAGVGQVPDAARALQVDAAWWSEQLDADGLHPDRVLVVRRAAEGAAVALASGEEDPENTARTRELLLDLIRGAVLPS